MTDNAEIADLKRQLAEVKAALTPTWSDPAAMGAWRDEMHQLAERRASRAGDFSAADLAEMERACPTAAVKDIAAHGHIPSSSISAAPTSQQVSGVHSNSGVLGSKTGWAPEHRFGPQPGIQIDSHSMT